MRIGLGTAQFGLDYGITNKAGRVSEEEVGRILDAAEAAGITMLDTAQAYGVSEEVLARLDAGNRFKVVTKIPKGGEAPFCRAYGLLTHDPADLPRLWPAMVQLKDEGLVEKIGVSIYEADEIPDYPIDLIQVPFNPLDQRLVDGGHLWRLKSRGVEIHARSIFLQGALLSETLPEHLAPIAAAADEMRGGMDRLEWVLATVLQCPYIDCFMVGVTSVAELMEIISAAGISYRVRMEPGPVPPLNPRYLNPAKWQELV